MHRLRISSIFYFLKTRAKEHYFLLLLDLSHKHVYISINLWHVLRIMTQLECTLSVKAISE